MNLHDYQMELARRNSDAQHKYVYFILAANGSAIAFTVQLIISKNLSQHLWMLFIAIMAWGLSFLFGCIYLSKSMTIMNLNMVISLIENDPEYKKEIEGRRNQENKKASSYFNQMFGLLLTGMCIFILWFFVYEFINIKW